MTTFTTVRSIDRDRYGRPMVIPPGGGKPVTYTRCTRYVDCVDDKYNLNRWSQRMVVLGLTERPDLLLSAAAHRDDKDTLNRIVDDATEAAKAHAAATIGTAVHRLAEQHDRGQPIGTIPGDYRRDLDAYIHATAGFTHAAVERFLVHDQLKVGGTPDRISQFEGGTYIADIKTGSIEYNQLTIAMQLAVYSRCLEYDPATGQRQPIHVDQNNAIIIHVPAGTGTCRLHWVNIARGWQAVQTATAVREWRKIRGLTAPFDPAATAG